MKNEEEVEKKSFDKSLQSIYKYYQSKLTVTDGMFSYEYILSFIQVFNFYIILI